MLKQPVVISNLREMVNLIGSTLPINPIEVVPLEKVRIYKVPKSKQPYEYVSVDVDGRCVTHVSVGKAVREDRIKRKKVDCYGNVTWEEPIGRFDSVWLAENDDYLEPVIEYLGGGDMSYHDACNMANVE